MRWLEESGIRARGKPGRHASLRANRDALFTPEKVPFERWRRGNPGPRRHPPYGFCWYNGKLVEDPREYPMVQLMLSLWTQGRTIGEIVRYLNEKGYRSRLNRDWGYGVVQGVIKRSGSK